MILITKIVGFLILSCALSWAPTAHAQNPRPLVVLISVDGLGSHLLSSFKTNDVPSLTRLARDGDQAIRAETVAMAKTIPGHASMLSGVDVAKHGRTQNDLDPTLKKIEVPTLFDLLKKNDLRSSAVFGKEKLHFLFDTGTLEESVFPKLWPIGDYYGRWPGTVESLALKTLSETAPDFLFLHYGAVDAMGHAFDWGSRIQRWAVRKVDRSLGRVLLELEKTNREFVILLTADHGGNDVSHGQMNSSGQLRSPETDLVIPWIVYRAKGPAARRLELRPPQGIVKVWDTAPSIAAILDLEVPAAWNWDGVNRLKIDREVLKSSGDTPKPNAQ